MDQLAAFLVDADGSEKVVAGSYVQLSERVWSWSNTAKPGPLTQVTLIPLNNLPVGVTIDEDLR
jgi:hypothetical protein